MVVMAGRRGRRREGVGRCAVRSGTGAEGRREEEGEQGEERARTAVQRLRRRTLTHEAPRAFWCDGLGNGVDEGHGMQAGAWVHG
jgi:hypothetical protein